MRKQTRTVGLGSMLLVGTMAALGLAGTASASNVGPDSGTYLQAHLRPLNNSGGAGTAVVVFTRHDGNFAIDASGLAKGLPHAQHLHFGADARHECPTTADDTNVDGRLNTTEGLPAYGPVRKSLTTYGDTSPASVLAVDRYPTWSKGVEHYRRAINFSSVALRKAIKNGQGVIVIHGVDYNANGVYDFDSAGPSDLDPSLPEEATAPAICGVLRLN